MEHVYVARGLKYLTIDDDPVKLSCARLFDEDGNVRGTYCKIENDLAVIITSGKLDTLVITRVK